VLPPFTHLVVKDGERLISHSTGGGGYGPPLERDPELVRDDVLQGFVSVERAQRVYGVALEEAGQIDAEATEELRRT
jgi:N-methylhydantoinase B